jgi:EmrB/QacA subfamily drug resistance transporter
VGLTRFVQGREQVGPQGVALIVASALFMINLDGAIINSSLPQIGRSFGVSAAEVNAGITAYLLAVAAFVPLSGWLSDRYGTKRLFAVAIAIFTIASIACGAATSLQGFMLARIVQGVGAALMMPVGRAIVLRKAEGPEIMRATAMITWPALIAPVVGPVLGGAITTWLDWRWNFLLNAPLGLVGALLVLAYAPDHRADERRSIDLVGFGLTSGALMLLIYALEGITRPDGAVRGLAALAGGLGLGASAIVWLRRARHPLLDLAPFKLSTFRVANLDAGTLQRIALSATPFLLPLMLQETWRLNPFQAGLIVLIYFAGNLAMKTVTTPLLRRFGFRAVLSANGLMVAASVAACGLVVVSTPLWLTGAVVLVAGASRSLQFTALNTLGFVDMPGAQRTTASTLSSMSQQMAMAIGVAAGALLLHMSQDLRGTARLGPEDFRLAFAGVGLCALIGALLVLRLAPDAGSEVTGHRPKARV